MKLNKTKDNVTDLVIYNGKLKNGLDVYLVPFTNKNNYFISLGVKFGSVYDSFVPFGSKDMKKMPLGIAHFLEHKMFEQEDGIDPFTFFSKTGTNANASTNYKNTQYICYGNNNIEENLKYLLDFVSEPYFTDKNVEKEKGIITQEINMYDDDPEWFLDEEIRKSVFKIHPIRNDIAGTEEEINKITKEDLYTCYNTFYNPNNMFLIVVGNIDVSSLNNIIDEYDKIKGNKVNLRTKSYEEPDEVFCKTKTLKFNVVIPKVAYAIKINKSVFGEYDDYKLHLYLAMFLSLKFGLASEFREQCFSKKLINYLYYFSLYTDKHIALNIMSESNKPLEYLEFLKNEFKICNFKEADIERMKRVWISSEVQMDDSISTVSDNILDDLVEYGEYFNNKIDIIKSLKLEELKEIVAKIDFNNSAEVIIEKK